jgi:nitrite reductase/ring-hydroxylating ferredoxin subunit
MAIHFLEQLGALHDGYMRGFEVGGHPVLLVQQNGVCHAVRNRCGHFGVPLHTGYLKPGVIGCVGHGIEFSLETGAIVNRPWENAEPIAVYKVVIEGDRVGVELP